MKKRTGYYGDFGGRFVPETLMPAILELERYFSRIRKNRKFNRELAGLLRDYAGRPTPLTFAGNISRDLKCRVYLKREDLCHTGAHKINNALGQALLAKYMGKKRIIAETGAGQHGVATATACALLGLECVVYMGTEDMERQKLNVFRMELLGARVKPVANGSKTLKDAINEALRDWMASAGTTHYLLGSALGPHPFPLMVREFQSVIGRETRRQILRKEGRLPTVLIACVGGGSNAIGLFHPFLKDEQVRMYGVEAGGRGRKPGDHASRFHGGGVGILHGTRSYVLQDEWGQILPTHSVSAGLDYPAVGPEHARLHESGRVRYDAVDDAQALAGFSYLARREGIIPALESAHAVAYLQRLKPRLKPRDLIIVNISGRGDKDIHSVYEHKGNHGISG